MERLAVAAVFDGAFAVAAGQVLECRLVSADAFSLPAVPGVPVGRLWREIGRRRQVLAARRDPVAHDRDRIVPVSWLDRSAIAVSPEQWDILTHADGRRTARDLAFVLGRGVYAITLEIARLLDAGLVQVGSRREVPLLEPLPIGGPPATAGPVGEPGHPDGVGGAQDMTARPPRRRPGTNPVPGAGGSLGIAGRWAARLPHVRASGPPSTEWESSEE
jgi:hypothetical protein